MAGVPTVKLNNGLEMPLIGFGTYAREAEPGQYQRAVESAIEIGYRHIDTASSYNNEVEVGDAIINRINEETVTREDIFLTTKLWNTKHAEDDVVVALKESLERLDQEYVDMYLIHWPVSTNHDGEDTKIDFCETWRGMEKALEAGLTKSIGICNFNEAQITKLLENCSVKPAVHQFEINLTMNQNALVKFCKDKEIQPVAYTPLGLLSEARPEFKGKDIIKEDPKLTALAEKYGKSKPQIALRYLIQRDIVVIPKTFTKCRMAENMNIFDFELTDSEMSLMNSFNLYHRCVPALAFNYLDNFPF